jgi:hypothetical protein
MKESSALQQVEIVVYYHTRAAAEQQPNLYAQATVFPSQETVDSLAKLGFYEKAAVVLAPSDLEAISALEVAYEKTQNIRDSWTKNEGVTAFTEFSRSSMMGDVFVINDKAYTVAAFGFEALDRFSPEQATTKSRVRDHDSEGPSL